MLAFRLHREKSDSSVNRGHSLSNDSGEVELCQTIHWGMQHRIFSGVGRSFPINTPTLAHQQTKWHDHVPSDKFRLRPESSSRSGRRSCTGDSVIISDCHDLQLLYADYFDTSRSSDYVVRCMDCFPHQPQFCKFHRSCLS